MCGGLEVPKKLNEADEERLPSTTTTPLTTMSSSDGSHDEYHQHHSHLLRGGRPPYPNILSKREMESLSAICDTFLPSIVDISGKETVDDSEAREFYATSASMAKTTDHVGGLLSGRLRHPAVGLLRLALWLLSTWWGTFLLCGTMSLSNSFPHFQKFSDVSQEKREKIVLSWSLSSFFLFGMLFKAMKYATTLNFFSKVDEKNRNPSWKAIGYCGPDPRFFSVDSTTQSSDNQPSESSSLEDDKNKDGGQLHDIIIGGSSDDEETLHEAFRRAGFSTTSTTASSLTVHCDVVVVGSGCGGSVVAGELAKAGHKVIVVEKGRYFARENLSLLEGPTIDQMYEGAGLLSTDDMGVVVLAGSTVGGGSTVNWSASIRTPQHVLNEWCDDHEVKLFGSKAFRHALDAVCDRMGVQGDVSKEGFNNSVLRKGSLELGYPVTTVARNAPKDHSCGWCQLGCKDGGKKSVQETWLSDIAHSGNGVVLQNCTVTKILHRPMIGKDRNIARGIVGEVGDKKQRIIISAAVTVVAGGALNTPALLKRSGLKNPNIGKNLHLHPVVMAWGHFPETTESDCVWPEVEKRSYEGGIITSMCTTIANFETSGYGTVIQTPGLHPGMFSVLMPWTSSTDFRLRMAKFSRTAHLFALARDRGSGCVSDYPKSFTYGLDSRDEDSLNSGIERMLRILAAAGATEIGTHHRDGMSFDVKRGTREEFEEFVRESSGRKLRDLSTPICSAHQMGSCRMGTEAATSAVNQRGETWEVEGLFVADTSVFPTALGVNPMVTVQAISYCTAQSILEFLNRKKN